jgi:hypothetical protein
VRCTLDVVSVQVVRWCNGGTVRGGAFILCYGKGSQTVVTVLCRYEILSFYCPWICSTDVAVGCVGSFFNYQLRTYVTGTCSWLRN